METMDKLRKPNRERQKDRKEKKFPHQKNKHHLTAESKGGQKTPDNILNIYIEKHFYWHKIFKLMDLDEVILLLLRLRRLKKRQKTPIKNS